MGMKQNRASATTLQLRERIAELNSYLGLAPGYRIALGGGRTSNGSYHAVFIVNAKEQLVGVGRGKTGTKLECLNALKTRDILKDMIEGMWLDAVWHLKVDKLFGSEHALIAKSETGNWKVWIDDEAFQALWCAPTGVTKHIFYPLEYSDSPVTFVRQLMAVHDDFF